MAPTAPTQEPRMSHRAKALARLADPTLPRKVHRDNNAVTDAFLHSKRDKQTIRKSVFRARVADSAAAARSSRTGATRALRRRRPSKKLVATLQSLADALPELEEGGGKGAEDEHSGGASRRRTASLHSRPGALKRKEKVVKAEMARFGTNLAQLTATHEDSMAVSLPSASDDGAASTVDDVSAAPTTKASTANRWALLRTFISSTMEQSPAFENQS
ncbi:hypothetical protein CMQ_213 [Grosmannia clavigera kw1407]|uniref:Ribosome biogenesis protein SLX9 n=1 Tax=Grosmannia clavigera (strain kw1407 / UAMH 11150) TaxID=655863 RepID=F0XQX3_GROCL|nr:uncharacterized protein CMQ_213 [Grosmannia clavigera kw1407]EFW99895.1 hypothetical protein CMQ_213 [Grosmannia clavigera kw1407]